MTDRELLEAAARAAGMQFKWRDGDPKWGPEHVGPAAWINDCWQPWNPRADSGQALELAVKLGICFGPNLDGDMAVCFGGDGRNITEPFGADPYAATRRAIVRAAAALAPTTGSTDGRS